MQRVIINELGPISHAEISCNKWMVFTGSQSSGKSTVAKVLYFFRTVKDDIFSLIIKRATIMDEWVLIPDEFLHALSEELQEKFIRVFGSYWGLHKGMRLEYYYDEETFIKIAPKKNRYDSIGANSIEYSPNITEFLLRCDNTSGNCTASFPNEEKALIREELGNLFKDKSENIYIPAGRSMITLLALQLNYIYSTMEDSQKQTIDFCTRRYLENIIRLRPEFQNGLTGLENTNPLKTKRNKPVLDLAKKLAREILKGSYNYQNGDERLVISSEKSVSIGFASSGQQEVVWILNLLFYYMLHGKPATFIIEEPESNLFPASQKLIIDFIALAGNAGHNVILTTHSPYVLGSINNLLFAGQIPEEKQAKANEIVNEQFWIQTKALSGWFIKDGAAENCIDAELGLIQNELIDEISTAINRDFDSLLGLMPQSEGDE
ncbi:MAG: AAA family ATPase [Clostridiales bacterium]|jgi:energy-coupling factor transporter ATP-binding protein EcfA2|nr:AAA family ATPase [Clostridiales bacterium]